MSALNILIALFIPTFFGISLIRFFDAGRRHPLSSLLPVGFGLGFGFLTHWMLFLSIIQIDFSRLTVGIPFLIGGFVLIAKTLLKKPSAKGFAASPMEGAPRPKSIPLVLMNAMLTLYITYILLFVCVRSVMVPVLEWDAISWIALKGKIFFYEKSIFQHAALPNSAYPLHVNLSMTWIALNLGHWSETLVKVIFPAYLIAYCCLHYHISKVYLDRLWSKVSLALLLSAFFFNYHATIAYRDIVMMFYFCGSILLLLLWHKMKNNNLLVISSLFLGFASFVKLEGVLYLCIGLSVLSFADITKSELKPSRKWLYLLKISIIPIIIFLFYYIYKIIIGAKGYMQDHHIAWSANIPLRMINLINGFGEELLLSGNWHIIWFLYILSLFYLQKNKNTFELILLGTTVSLYFLTYFLLALTTGLYNFILGIDLSGVLPRILLHVYPLSVFFIAVVHGKPNQSSQEGPSA